MGFDVVVVGGGTAGCVLAARLSENADRRVCLVEAGPDYGPLADGRWPAEILDASELAFTHAWEPGADDGRTLGGRILGGSSAMNACMVLAGSPDDYDEWGGRWSYAELRPFLERAARAFRTRPWTDEPTPFQTAFLDAATKAGHVHLADPNDPASPVGVAPAPRNVHQSRRWNAAFAFLEDARQRPNLTIVPDTLVDRVLLDGTTATGVATSDGQRIEAPVVFLAAGAYFSPAILMRSGIGPARALEALGIGVVEDLPVGERLLDHCGTDVSFDLSPVGAERVADHARVTGAFGVHAVVKAASSACEPGSWDLHLVPWVSATDREGEFRATIIVFHMKPLSSGSVRLGSTDANELPVADRGFLTREEDLVPLLEGIELAREIAATEPLASMLGAELLPGDRDGVRTFARRSATTSTPPGRVRSARSSTRTRVSSGSTACTSRTRHSCPRSRARTRTSRPRRSRSGSQQSSRRPSPARRSARREASRGLHSACAGGALLHGLGRGQRAPRP